MAGNIRIREAMRQLVASCCDARTGEVNCTQLAEMACQELNGYDAGEAPEAYFDCAVDVAGEYERKNSAAFAVPTALSGLVNSRDSSWF